MKKLLFLATVFFVFGQLNAQITLERADYTAEVGSSIFLTNINPNTAAIPSEGADQIWDYSLLEVLGSDTVTLNTYDGMAFPRANVFYGEKSLQGAGAIVAEFDRTIYEILNDTIHGQVGVTYQSLNIPLGALTGDPADSLNYIESNGIWPGNPRYYAWFPMNYGQTRASNYIVDNQFLLTLRAFGLDHVPGSLRAVGDEGHEVVGWGTLSLRNPTDQSMVSLEALLMKTTITEQDSLFLAGAPAPPPLLTAFGVTQGIIDTVYLYRFYAKGFSAPVLTLGPGEFWMLSDLSSVTSTEDVGHDITHLKYFPNPASDEINLQFDKLSGEPWTFSFFNTLGQKASEHIIDHPRGLVNKTIRFGQSFIPGNYFYVLQNGTGKVMSSGSLQVN